MIFNRKRAALVLAIVLCISAAMVIGVQRLETTTDFAKFLPKEYPSIKTLYEFERRFPQTSTVLFVVSGENLAKPEGVIFLRALENSLLSDPAARTIILRVQSFADYVVPLDQPLPPEPLLEDLIENVLSNENLRKEIVGRSLSVDCRHALVTVNIYPVRTSGERERIVKLFKAHAEGLENESFKIDLTGDIAITQEMKKLMDRDNEILIPAAGIFVLCVLFIAFRRPSDVLISLAVVGISSLWAVGLMGLLGIEFTTLDVALIPLLLGLGVDYSIYFLKRYYEEGRSGKEVLSAANVTVGTTGKAVAVAAITTMIGFASFGVSWLPPVRDLGFFAAIGIGCAFALSLTFLPSVIILRDFGKQKRGVAKEEKASRRLAEVCLAVEKRWKVVLLVVILLSIPSAVSAFSLKTSMSFETFLPSETESMKAFKIVENCFGGQMSAVVLAKGGVTSVEGLQEMLSLERAVLTDPRNSGLITHSWSIANLLMIAGGGTLPADNATLQVILQSIDNPSKAPLISGDNFAAIYFFVNAKSEDEMRRATEIIREHVENHHGTLDMRINGDPAVTGLPVILSDIMGSLWGSMLRSTILTVILCFLALVVLFRSPLLGTGAMLPLLLALSWEFGTIRLLGWSLDVFNMGVSALVIGLGIDYAVHITHRYLEERGRDPDRALANSLSKISLPILMGFITTTGVFAILSLSRMPAMARFGQLTALVVSYALLVAFFVLPAFLVGYGRWKNIFEKRRTKIVRK